RAAQPGRRLRHDPEPGPALRRRRRVDRDRHRAGAEGARGPVRAAGGRALNAVDRLAAAIGELAGESVELERPADPAHGDYATTAARRTAPRHRRPPRELAEELAATVVSLPEVERAEVAGPGFVNLWLADSFFREAVAEIGEDYGGGSAGRPERI